MSTLDSTLTSVAATARHMTGLATNCILVFDKIALKTKLVYNKERDVSKDLKTLHLLRRCITMNDLIMALIMAQFIVNQSLPTISLATMGQRVNPVMTLCRGTATAAPPPSGLATLPSVGAVP